ncbi:MAG TPA: hypothetical protein VGI58_19060 [Streptosporangiaceae bacterium]
MKATPPSAAENSAAVDATPATRLDGRAGDLLAAVGLVAVGVVVEAFLRHLLTRPFYYDEAWRAYDIAEGGRFLTHLGTAAAPLSLGWIGIENAARIVFGDNESGLRLPMFASLPVLGVVTYLLSRRWMARPASFCVAALLLVNLWIVSYALQLKSYSYEAVIAVATLALFLVVQRTTWTRAQLLGLYAALGLTCVLSTPNLFLLASLLALDLVRALRGRAVLRVAGAAVAAAIALAHYELFLRPQGRVASTGVFGTNFPPHGLAAFSRFALDGLVSYASTLITGVVGATGQTPSYALPPAAHGLLTTAVVVLLAAGIVAAARDAAGRALITAVGGSLLLELAGSALRQWPFGLARVNIFVLPLLYILAGMGALWLARGLAGLSRSATARLVSWRVLAMTATLAVVAGVVLAGGIATARGFTETSTLQYRRTIFDRVKAAVALSRTTATPADLVIVRADRIPPAWYASPWLYYMNLYQGWPGRVAALPKVPAQNTIAVVHLTPGAVDRFLATHRGSPAIYLLELNPPSSRPRFPTPSVHQQSLTALRQFGYCPVSETKYRGTGFLTVLRAGCS